MKESGRSMWEPSRFALMTMLGTFIGIYIVQRELNRTFAIGYLTVVALIVAGNAIYVLYKRKKSNAVKNENQEQE